MLISSKLTIITLLSFATVLISCIRSTNSNEPINEVIIDNTKDQTDKTNDESRTEVESVKGAQIQIDSKASGFVKNLKAGEKLSSFFSDSWLLIYHNDNRCDGSTDGQLDNLSKTVIDSIITLRVKNDGDGWACDKKEPKTYDLDFDLKKTVAVWDRFELADYGNQEENVVYVVGAGESDYLKLHYNNNNLITKLEYRSEDPG